MVISGRMSAYVAGDVTSKTTVGVGERVKKSMYN